MKGSKKDEAAWLEEANRLKNTGDSNSVIIPSVGEASIIPAVIRMSGCCEIILLGHRGGLDNPGIHNSNGPVLPDDTLESQIANAVAANKRDKKCTTCTIRLGACGIRHGTASDVRQICNIYNIDETTAKKRIEELAPYEEFVRQNLANVTGCRIESPDHICQIGLAHTLLPGGAGNIPGDSNNFNLENPKVTIYTPQIGIDAVTRPTIKTPPFSR